MQVKTITVNAANTTAMQNGQSNGTPLQANNSTFPPQCKVTISKEGKKLSRQLTEQPQGSSQDAAMRRIMLRRDEESELSEKITEGYREQLENIQKELKSLNSSFSAGTFKKVIEKETIEKEQEVLRDMRLQKEAQLEENQRRAKEAQELAMLSSKYQEDIDGNNRKLWTLLKTLEEAEEAEEEREDGYAEDGDDSGTPREETSVGDTILNSASQFIAASMGRDLYVDGKLEWLEGKGHQYVDFANKTTSDILKESEDIIAALDDENYTDDMRAELMDRFKMEAMLGYDMVKKARGNGLHILQEARDYRIKRIADNPLAGMQETKDSMMMSVADAVLGEARQSRLEEASEELNDKVQELIDRRNDVDRVLEEDEEEDEKELTYIEVKSEKEEKEDGYFSGMPFSESNRYAEMPQN